MTAPILLIGIGNPSRGDDALGPLAIERLAVLKLPDVELLTDFQLQVEFALDVAGRREVVFIDAAASGPEPFELRPIQADSGLAHTSHALAPEAVLAACTKIGVMPPMAAWVLAIRGQAFELGEGLSAAAARNLEAALTWLQRRFEPATRR